MYVRLGKYPGPRSKKERVEKIRIDPWDTWDMDHTLAMIIHPMLIQLKEKKQGFPGEMFRLVGVPEETWNYTKEQEEQASDKWNEVLDAMIWSFNEINNGDYLTRLMQSGLPDWLNHVKEHEDRIQKGISLFGQYFRALWD